MCKTSTQRSYIYNNELVTSKFRLYSKCIKTLQSLHCYTFLSYRFNKFYKKSVMKNIQ